MDLLSDFVSLQPMPGSDSGETFLAEAAGGERSVVRIYARPGERGEVAHQVDAALLTLTRDLVPVPQVLEARRGDVATGMPALLVTAFLPGEPGDRLLARLSEAGESEALTRFGQQLGGIAAALAGVAMLRPGRFLDGELRIGRPRDEADLPSLVAARAQGLRWSDEEVEGLRAAAHAAQELLDSVERSCLVHGDLRPANVLVDAAGPQVTGLVDWECAHAGHPFTDLGSLLRHDRHPAYVEGVLEAWTERHGGDRQGVLDLARAADVASLVELVTASGAGMREGMAAEPGRAVVEAHALLRAIAGTGDLHAVPDGP